MHAAESPPPHCPTASLQCCELRALRVRGNRPRYLASPPRSVQLRQSPLLTVDHPLPLTLHLTHPLRRHSPTRWATRLRINHLSEAHTCAPSLCGMLCCDLASMPSRTVLCVCQTAVSPVSAFVDFDEQEYEAIPIVAAIPGMEEMVKARRRTRRNNSLRTLIPLGRCDPSQPGTCLAMLECPFCPLGGSGGTE